VRGEILLKCRETLLALCNGKYNWQIADITPSASIHPSGVFLNSPDSPPGVQLSNPVVGKIDYKVAGVEWEFRAAPKDGWPTLSGDFWIQFCLLLVGGIVSLVSRMINVAVSHAQKKVKIQLKGLRTSTMSSDLP